MVLMGVTATFSDLALQIIAGAIAAGLTGRAMRGGGFGILGDLVFGIAGAIAANFVVSYFGLFDAKHFGLIGEIVVAIIGAILLVVIVHLFASRRSARAEA
ncbi:MAG TPA: GlsB/YeaQ/YmgE family stress response membrane protein [Ktedonobacterales bacterium]|nr:GlsB/YeaQ/YmgE family stress response membrane protein [Ktedonobacterales bacterium]